MRQSSNSVNSINRLLKLLLILLVLLVNESQVSALPFNIHKLAPNLNGQASVTRNYRVWNFCTNRFLRIRSLGKKGIDARGKRYRKFTRITITSIDGGFVRIQGMENQYYLCFSPNGKLKARANIPKSNPESCDFVQNLTANMYYTFQSRANLNWSVGFKKKGRPFPGYKVSRPNFKHKNCFRFALEELNKDTKYVPVRFEDLAFNYDPEAPRKEQKFLKNRKRKVRHRKRKRLSRRRKGKLRLRGRNR